MITVTGVVGENVHGFRNRRSLRLLSIRNVGVVPAKRSRPEIAILQEASSTSMADHRPYLNPAFPEAQGGST